MCISEFILEEETLSPVYPAQWNIFLQDSSELFANSVSPIAARQEPEVEAYVAQEEAQSAVSAAA